MDTRFRARFSAFFTHLLLSVAVIAAFSLVVYLIWYPSPYHVIQSTWDGSRILIMVDVVLGPLLTLILFDIRKPVRELKRDISLVVLIQVSALIWGGHIIYQMRPLVAAYYEQAFYIVTKENIEPSDMNHPLLPAFYEKPKLVYVKRIEDAEARQKFYGKVLSGKEKPPVLQPGYYLDIEAHYAQLQEKGRLDLGRVSNDAGKLRKLNDFWDGRQGQAEDYCYYPVLSGSFVATLVMDCTHPDIIGLIPGRL